MQFASGRDGCRVIDYTPITTTPSIAIAHYEPLRATHRIGIHIQSQFMTSGWTGWRRAAHTSQSLIRFDICGGARILNTRIDMSDHYYVKKALRHIDYVPIVNSEEEVRNASKTGEECCYCLRCCESYGFPD